MNQVKFRDVGFNEYETNIEVEESRSAENRALQVFHMSNKNSRNKLVISFYNR